MFSFDMYNLVIFWIIVRSKMLIISFLYSETYNFEYKIFILEYNLKLNIYIYILYVLEYRCIEF